MYKYFIYHTDLKQPKEIEMPVGWDALGKTLARDRKYHGIFLNYTTKLQFIKGGKNLIESLYQTYGVEAVIILIILRRDSESRYYLKDYEGRLNLTTRKLSRLYFECNVENTGFLQQFYNTQQIKYAVSDTGVQTINMPSIVLQEKLLGTTKGNLGEVTGVVTGHGLSYRGSNALNYVIFTPSDYDVDEFGEHFDYPYQVSTTDPTVSRLYFIKAKRKSTITDFSGHLYISSDPGIGTTHTLKWYLKYGTQKNGYTTVQLGGTLVSGGGDLAITGEFIFSVSSFDVAKNDEIYFYGVHTYPDATDTDDGSLYTTTSSLTNHYSTLSITARTLDDDSDAKIIPVFEFANNLIGKMTGKSNRLKSDFYGRTENGYSEDGAGSLRGITNGGQIKQKDISLNPIYGQFDQAFKTLKAIDNIGIGLETVNGVEYIRIEHFSFFYKKVELFKLNNILDIESTPITGDYSNSLETGYEKYDYSKLSSLDEFNTKRQFGLPITQIQNLLSYLSPYIGSGYTIELVRRDRINAATTKDQQADSNNFIIQLRRDGSDLIVDRDEDFTAITNVIAGATMYNFKLSPERMARAHGSELRSFLEKQKAQSIIQTFSEGNSQMTSQLATESAAVAENADIPIDSLDRPIFLSEQFAFKAKLTRPQLLTLFANPYGYISFSKTDRDYKRMYVLEAARNPNDNSVKFKGIQANI